MICQSLCAAGQQVPDRLIFLSTPRTPRTASRNLSLASSSTIQSAHRSSHVQFRPILSSSRSGSPAARQSPNIFRCLLQLAIQPTRHLCTAETAGNFRRIRRILRTNASCGVLSIPRSLGAFRYGVPDLHGHSAYGRAYTVYSSDNRLWTPIGISLWTDTYHDSKCLVCDCVVLCGCCQLAGVTVALACNKQRSYSLASIFMWHPAPLKPSFKYLYWWTSNNWYFLIAQMTVTKSVVYNADPHPSPPPLFTWASNEPSWSGETLFYTQASTTLLLAYRKWSIHPLSYTSYFIIKSITSCCGLIFSASFSDRYCRLAMAGPLTVSLALSIGELVCLISLHV